MVDDALGNWVERKRRPGPDSRTEPRPKAPPTEAGATATSVRYQACKRYGIPVLLAKLVLA